MKSVGRQSPHKSKSVHVEGAPTLDKLLVEYDFSFYHFLRRYVYNEIQKIN